MTSPVRSPTSPAGRTDDLRDDERRLRRARLTRRLFLAVVALFVVLGTFNVFGVRTAETSRRQGPWALEVEYPQVNRGGLPAPFAITIRHDGGFDGPVRVRVASEFLGMFDENGLDPDPDASTGGDGYVEWTFEPPDGEVLVVDLDARIEPGRRGPVDGWVEIVEDAGPAPRVTFRTWLAP